MTSFLTRLTLGFGLFVSLTTLVSGVAVSFISEQALRKNLDDALIELARTEVASATDLGFVHVHESEPQTLSVQGIPGYEKFVWIVDSNDTMVARSMNVGIATEILGGEPQLAMARSGKQALGDLQVHSHLVRAIYYPFNDPDGKPLVGTVAVPLQPLNDSVEAIRRLVISIGIAISILGFGIAYLFARSMVKPLEKLEQTAASVDPSSGEGQIGTEAPYKEIRSMVSTLNGLLARVRSLITEKEATIRTQQRFVSDASHELRTPVSNIQGTLEVALRKPRSNEEYRDVIAESLVETRRMGRLVSELLLLARSDSAALILQKAPITLEALVEPAVCNGHKLAATLEKRIEWTVDIAERQEVCLDSARVAIVLDNLIGNAVRYCDQQVEIDASVDEGGRLFLRVRNDGPVIPVEERERVFERFYRGDESRSRDSGGTGLGLTIAREIIEAHQGSIHIGESSTGRLEILVELPIV